MKKKKSKKKTIVVSFISGKGGVGKTALTAAVGKLLAIMGYKVLLIDSDFTTHGLTFLLGFNRRVLGILEFFKVSRASFEKTERKSQDEFFRTFRLTLHLSENLDFIQSTSRASLKYSEMVFSKSMELNEFLRALLRYYSKIGRYDFILVDSQAGSVPSTFVNVANSTKTATVMEPDPISTYATKNLVGELGDALPRESYYVINKLSVEEAAAYVAIERFLKILDHLPPVPFDFEVRRAFMVRQIPIDENKPSPFMFGVIRLVRDLLPQVSERLDKLEIDMEEKALQPTRLRIEEIEKKLDFLAEKKFDIEHHIDELESRKERPAHLIKRGVISLLPIVMLAYVIFTFVLLYGLETISFNAAFGVGIMLSAFLVSVYFTWLFLQEKIPKKTRDELRELEKELAILQENRERLRSEHESYRALLVTRSKELMLKSEKNKDR